VTAIAGVMGGHDSEVTRETTDILLECAYFDPKRIRKTRQALKMSTDASYRFERGIDLEGMADALRRAVVLIRAVAGGTEPEEGVDVHPKPSKPRSVFLRPARVEHLLGVPLALDAIEGYLVRLGFPVAPKEDRLHVQIPGWRPDVTGEVDLIEEVARLHGYDAFPVEMRPFRPSTVPSDPIEALKARIRTTLTGLGLYEARSLSLTARGGADAFRVQNPLSAEDAYLRRDLLGGLVRSVERNWAVRERDVRLFEIGASFRDTGAALPEETLRIGAVVTGGRSPAHWSSSGKVSDYGPWDVKGLFEAVAAIAGGPGRLVTVGRGWEWQDPEGGRRGSAGPLEADRPVWAGEVYGFELEIVLPEAGSVRFRALPSTPPVERDVALVLPPGVSAAQVEEIVRGTAGALLADCRIFDEYRAKGMEGRSVAWRLVFRAPDRTLKDQEADEALARVLAGLKEQLGVERREA
jgi:phenylalanyl-tRNA synthetase beta chain